MKNDFFKHYQIGCWYYRPTTFGFPYDPVELQKDFGVTFFTTPEHWRSNTKYINLNRRVSKTLGGYFYLQIRSATALQHEDIFWSSNYDKSGC